MIDPAGMGVFSFLLGLFVWGLAVGKEEKDGKGTPPLGDSKTYTDKSWPEARGLPLEMGYSFPDIPVGATQAEAESIIGKRFRQVLINYKSQEHLLKSLPGALTPEPWRSMHYGLPEGSTVPEPRFSMHPR